MGDLDGAAVLFAESLELAHALDDPRHEATTLNNLALIQLDRGALDEARAMLDASLTLKLRIGARAETAIILGNLALISWLQRDLRRAIELLEEALTIERETDNPVGIADALGNLAQVLSEAGESPRAATLHRESLLLRHEICDWLSMPYSLEAIAAAAVLAGHVAPAVRLLAASHALREATSAPLPATDRVEYDETIARATRALGEAAFAALWREGLIVSRDAAVEAALTLCDAIAAGPAGDEATIPESAVAAATMAS
jgi:tetratricopeptide (TPR) repeat protein